MPPADLTTPERTRLHGAIRFAFYDRGKLDNLLFLGEGLGVSLDEITAGGPLADMVTAVIKWAEAEGKTDALIKAAYAAVPGSPPLKTFYATYTGSAQRQVTRSALQSLTNSAVDYKEPSSWRDRMARAENCVCCVVIDGQREGTGFLAAPALVITNNHVIDEVDWKSIRLEFDYQVDAAGTLLPSRYYALAAAPLVVSQPHDVDERHPKPAAPPPDDSVLDYALLSVDGAPEADLMADGRQRGFIAAPPATPKLEEKMPLLILQHPQKPPRYRETPDLRPLRFAFDTVLAINENSSRVRYRVRTEPGASGSPCFDSDWNLIALHHAGDPRGDAVGADAADPFYNEGIPIAAIRRSLPAAIRQQLNWT